MAITIYHASDLHFGSSLTSQSIALLAHIFAGHFRDSGAFLLVTGDITDDGSAEQYELAARHLRPFAGRLLACPGNHDVGPQGNLYSPEAVQRYHEQIDPLTVLAGDGTDHLPHDILLQDGEGCQVLTVGLNSTLYTPTPFDFACGQVGDEQRLALQAKLCQASLCRPRGGPVPTLVYLHHRPFRFPFLTSMVMRLRDADRFLDIVEASADVVAFGHSGSSLDVRRRHGEKNHSTLEHFTTWLDANAAPINGAYFKAVFGEPGSRPQISTVCMWAP